MIIKKILFENWIIIVIFCVALFLRTYNLSEFPVGLHGDEASIGYTAYSLLKTGKDQNGIFMPISINQFGDYRPAGYHYLDVPFVALLGLDTLAVRLPAAIFGALTIIVFYFLVTELLENKFIGLLSSGLLAILPWDINISRASSEAVIASFFVLVGLYFCIKEFKSKSTSSVRIATAIIVFAISFFFYHAPRYILPMLFPFLVAILYFMYRPIKKKIIGMSIIYMFILLSFMFFFIAGKGTGRATEVSLLSIPGGTTQLKTAMDEEGTLNPILTRFYDNKLYFYGRLFLTFYSEHVSLDYLFVNTGLPVRYAIPFTGNLYIIEAPFLFFGLVVLLYEGIKKRKYIYLFPVIWFLIAPIPAAVTWEDLPNVIRSSFMIYALMIIIAFGFYQSLLLFKKNITFIIIVVSALILAQNFLYFYHNYFWRLKIQEPWFRSASEPDLIFKVDALLPKYSQVIMTTDDNNNLIFNLFYNKFDPKKFQQMGSPIEKENLHFGKFTYVYEQCPISGDQNHDVIPKDNILYVDRQSCNLPRNARVLDTVHTPDGATQFMIVDLLPPTIPLQK